jgi:hypothetical protein
MSQEDVELVRGVMERFATTQAPVLDVVADDSVWDMSEYAGWPEDQEYLGRDGIRRFIETWLDAWEDYEMRVGDIADAPRCVVVAVTQSGRPRGSAARVEMHFAQQWFVDGPIVRRVVTFDDLAEARRSAGLDG